MQPSNRLAFRVFLFLSTIILLILSFGVSLAAESELICSHQPIVALVGDDVILPCHLEPPISASSETVVWTKPPLDPKYIHVHEEGRLKFELQNPSYIYRTRLFVDELMKGNVSMKIFKVKLSDAGKYQCFLQSAVKEASIQLTVGAVSTPVIQAASKKNGSVVLQCECAGWYPEPEVLWLDAEGNLLSAGPTETVRGPDDLYTVSSRLTVEKRHSNSFTCRVQQKDIHQTRETQIHVPDHFFTDQSSLYWTLGIYGLVIALLVLLCFILRKYIRRNWEIVTNMVERNNIKSNSPQLSRLTEQEEEQENQGSTGEGRERADQQEKEKRNTEEPLKTKEEQEEMETMTALIHSVKKMGTEDFFIIQQETRLIHSCPSYNLTCLLFTEKILNKLHFT